MALELMQRQITQDEQDAFAATHPGFRVVPSVTDEDMAGGIIPAGTHTVILLDDTGIPADHFRGQFRTIALAEEWLRGWLDSDGD